MGEMKYVAVTGMLGAGFKEESLEASLDAAPAFLGCDAGSVDGGPYHLAIDTWLYSPEACRRDLSLALRAARRAGVPLLIGSCSGAGTNAGVDRFAGIVREVAAEDGLRFRLGRIYCEPDREVLVERLQAGRMRPLVGAPETSPERIRNSTRIVAMLGSDAYREALEQGADVILAGRSSDTAIYTAIPEMHGFDRGVVYHAAKIMECGTAATANRTGHDCMLCTLRDDHFEIEAVDPEIRCTPVSVAAHTLYEEGDPFAIVEPTGTLDTTQSRFKASDDRRVRVYGSRFHPASPQTLKLEGAELAGYRSSSMGSVRDPVILEQFDNWIAGMRAAITANITRILGDGMTFELSLRTYGRNGTLGSIEPEPRLEGHEALLLFDVVAPTQEMAAAVMRVADDTALHFTVPEWTGLITGLAHPYSPTTWNRGPVWRWNINHAVEVDEPNELLTFEYEQVG